MHDADLAAGRMETPLNAIEGGFQTFGSGALGDAVYEGSHEGSPLE